ncbi:MAG: hypothetical protein NTV49_02440 [Kiritimatiellaeota bacterium]|nr:hypothetical protein [Kiritimatiellota bacterium]
MKKKLLMAALVIGSAGLASAATLGGLGMRDSLVETEVLARLSAGVDYAQMNRTMSLDRGGMQELRARVVSGQLGFDVLPWLTVFATAGRSEAKFNTESGYHSGQFKWSAGLKANWWHYDIADPDFLAGRLSFQSTAEFAQYRSGQGREELKWNEGYADLTLNFEVFSTKMTDTAQYPYSLVLYGGPAVSRIDGSAAGANFSEDRLLGVVGGVDLYISHNLSFGGQILHFDEYTLSASLRYHF